MREGIVFSDNKNNYLKAIHISLRKKKLYLDTLLINNKSLENVSGLYNSENKTIEIINKNNEDLIFALTVDDATSDILNEKVKHIKALGKKMIKDIIDGYEKLLFKFDMETGYFSIISKTALNNPEIKNSFSDVLLYLFKDFSFKSCNEVLWAINDMILKDKSILDSEILINDELYYELDYKMVYQLVELCSWEQQGYTTKKTMKEAKQKAYMLFNSLNI